MAGMSGAEFQALIADEFAFMRQLGVTIEEMGAGRARVRLAYRPLFLRPGGVIAGPFIMSLADLAMYAAILSTDAGITSAVTATMTTHFLRAARPGDIIAEAHLLGRDDTRFTGTIAVRTDADDNPVAFISTVYVMPSDAGIAHARGAA